MAKSAEKPMVEPVSPDPLPASRRPTTSRVPPPPVIRATATTGAPGRPNTRADTGISQSPAGRTRGLRIRAGPSETTHGGNAHLERLSRAREARAAASRRTRAAMPWPWQRRGKQWHIRRMDEPEATRTARASIAARRAGWAPGPHPSTTSTPCSRARRETRAGASEAIT